MGILFGIYFFALIPAFMCGLKAQIDWTSGSVFLNKKDPNFDGVDGVNHDTDMLTLNVNSVPNARLATSDLQLYLSEYSLRSKILFAVLQML